MSDFTCWRRGTRRNPTQVEISTSDPLIVLRFIHKSQCCPNDLSECKLKIIYYVSDLYYLQVNVELAWTDYFNYTNTVFILSHTRRMKNWFNSKERLQNIRTVFRQYISGFLYFTLIDKECIGVYTYNTRYMHGCFFGYPPSLYGTPGIKPCHTYVKLFSLLLVNIISWMSSRNSDM